MKADPNRTRRIYNKLMRIAPELVDISEHAVSKVSGLMDLTLDVLEQSNGYRRIALAHYWRHPSGDMIADPDMEIAVFLNDEMAEALTYQDTYLYEVAYPVEGEPPDVTVHGRLNDFLEHWLDNLREQGHILR